MIRISTNQKYFFSYNDFAASALSFAIDLFLSHNQFTIDLINTREAAEILRVTPIRVRQMIREGKIEAGQIGRDYVIEKQTLDSVKTYGKAGRPKKTEKINENNGDKKTFKTIFDVAPELVGCLDSGLGDLSTDKKYMKGFGTKEGEKGNR